jgi:hypothetical protein
MSTVAILPCAGKAERWGGLLKELLPAGPGYAMIDRTMAAFMEAKASAVHVVASIEKLGPISAHISSRWQGAFYSVQSDPRDLWGAVRQGIRLGGDRYLFAMPDTIYPVGSFTKDPGADLVLGLFPTDHGDRFGVVTNNLIMDKSAAFRGMSCWAWGVLMWSPRVAEWWIERDKRISSFPAALSAAMRQFGWTPVKLPYYHDICDFPAYADAIKNVL